MKCTLLSTIGCLLFAIGIQAQPGGGFGGFGGFQQQAKLETSQEWKDVNYAGDDQAYHTCDIYLPKKEAESYPVVIHIYGSAWFSNNSKGAADLGTIVKALLDAGYAVVCPNHRSSMDAKWPAQLHDIRAVIRFVRGEAKKYKFDPSFVATSGFSSGGHLSSTAATTSGIKQTKVGTYDIDLEGIPYYLAYFNHSFELEPLYKRIYFTEGHVSEDMRKLYKYKNKNIPAYQKLFRLLYERDQKRLQDELELNGNPEDGEDNEETDQDEETTADTAHL